MAIFSGTYFGLQAHIVNVECAISKGLPNFKVIGLGDKAIQESKERVKFALKNSQYSFPNEKLTVSLAPADLKKQGAILDLAVASSILLQSHQISNLPEALYLGELGLDGSIRYVPGIVPILLEAKRNGLRQIILPQQNMAEASLIEDLELYPINKIRDLDSLKKAAKVDFEEKSLCKIIHTKLSKFEIRLLTIAISGAHHLLTIGAPGAGKTEMIRSSKVLLPRLFHFEIQELTAIHSISGLLSESNPVIYRAPFREIHPQTPFSKIFGCHQEGLPGEMTLSHNGILFMDEIREYPQKVIDFLKLPMEDREITVHKKHQSIKFPSSCTILAASNPCPCGYHFSPRKKCTCPTYAVKKFQKRLSNALLDRFDLFYLKHDSELSVTEEVCTDVDEVRSQIQQCRDLQISRQNKLNSQLSFREIQMISSYSIETSTLIDKLKHKYKLSERAILKIMRIAQTIADLEHENEVTAKHLLEALQYRAKY